MSPTTLSVMTRNLYLGADLLPVMVAPDLPSYMEAASAVLAMVRTTDFPARAAVIAAEVAAAQPDLIGLQEVMIWRTYTAHSGVTHEKHDYLHIFIDALADQGLMYTPVAVTAGFDGRGPTADGYDVRIIGNNVILAREDRVGDVLGLSQIRTGTFGPMLSIPNPVLGTVALPRSWASVDVHIGGHTVRFVATHLEAYEPQIRLAQARELLAGPLATDLPVIVVGDFNDDANGTAPTCATLQDYGLIDMWKLLHPDDPGPTCCQQADLRNAESQLRERIDLILFRGALHPQYLSRIGHDPACRTPDGLWPSDHAGLVAKFDAMP